MKDQETGQTWKLWGRKQLGMGAESYIPGGILCFTVMRIPSLTQEQHAYR